MTFAIIFILVFIALGVFALYLSRNIDHGEARFDTRNAGESDEETK